MPHVTNARFVFALLSINDRLASLKGHDGIYIAFFLASRFCHYLPKTSRRQESYMINGIEFLLTQNNEQ
jgi:hypothetical protein